MVITKDRQGVPNGFSLVRELGTASMPPVGEFGGNLRYLESKLTPREQSELNSP
jgi:hypothetical protein